MKRGENASNQHFLLSHNVFKKILSQGCESLDCVLKSLEKNLIFINVCVIC